MNDLTPNSVAYKSSKSNITMYSFTYRRKEPELWFTNEHIHGLCPIHGNPIYIKLFGIKKLVYSLAITYHTNLYSPQKKQLHNNTLVEKYAE